MNHEKNEINSREHLHDLTSSNASIYAGTRGRISADSSGGVGLGLRVGF